MAQVGLLEDNVRIAKLCATMLQFVGHCVSIYEHPRHCLDALLSQPVTGSGRERIAGSRLLPVDVLILDLHLPDITGMEIVGFLRSHPHTKDLPLIFCTAAARIEVSRALQAAPRASFLEKPFTFQTLTSSVAAVLPL